MARDESLPACEVPPSKGAGDENFPVGSAFIAPALRPCVAAFYAFARGADDVADSPALSPTDKLSRLAQFEAGLDGDPRGPAVAHRLAAALAARGLTDRHARDLLAAFRQDATQSRYADWDALLGYCVCSAHPVGRFLLDLHGEDRALWPASDALCAALQVLNHLQDLGDDRAALDRVYLPLDWLAAEGIGVEALDAPRAAPALRRVIDRALDGCDVLIARAVRLPPALASRRLAAESAAIVTLARRLSGRLRRGDPLADRIKPGKADFALGALAGLRAALAPRGAGLRRAVTA